MKTKAFALAIALGLATVGCEEDQVPAPIDATAPAPSGGADAGAGGGAEGGSSSGMMCKGTFAVLTRAQLGAVTSMTAKCGKASDLDLICNDIGSATRSCGQTCYVSNPGQSDAMFVACTADCVKKMVPPGLSDDCNACYAGIVSCTLKNCTSPCAADPNSAACMQCQNMNGCYSTFFMCSGLPAPQTGGSADGGASRG